MTGSGPFVRRSRFLVVHWEGDGAHACNYATGRSSMLGEEALLLLDRAGRWLPAAELAAGAPAAAGTVQALVEAGFLERMDRPPPEGEQAMGRWGRWNPAAGFFHAATRDVPFVDEDSAPRPVVVARDHPPPLKRPGTGPRLDLPAAALEGGLADALRQRRSWRRFGGGGVSREHLGTLLGLTWGVQAWIDGPRPAPLKTSPSGGARHSIECYVVALEVEGVPAGTYHYAPDDHALIGVRDGVPESLLESLLPAQPGFRNAPLVVFMTSLLERVQYRYDAPRAYRVVMIEAGHLAQTFLLAATALGLAPFCTAAFADSRVEEHLGVDGLREPALYAVGAGPRPAGVSWAPWPSGERVPALRPPAHAIRGPDGATP